MSAISITSAQENSMKVSKEAITAQGNKIRLVDSHEDLEVYCYVRCTAEDNEIVRSCRGVVFQDGKNLLQTYPCTREVTEEELDDETRNKFTMSECRAFEAHEGTLLRIFSHGDYWYVSTHRKLDAYRSKWASRQSFGAQFSDAIMHEYSHNDAFKTRLDAVEETTAQEVNVYTTFKDQEISDHVKRFFSSLDVQKCYCFLVRNTQENRIVCQAPSRPTMYHVGTFEKESGQFDLDSCVDVPSPVEHKFESWEELQSFTSDTSEEMTQGVIIFDGVRHIKVLNARYAYLFSVRGNEPSVKFRYLQIRMDRKLTDDLYSLYPRQTDNFEAYENILYQISKSVYDAYVSRFIKKKYVTLPREQYQVMRACHAWHLEDRRKNRISLRKVIEKLNEQTATNLNKMVRQHLQQENEKQRESENATEENVTEETEETEEQETEEQESQETEEQESQENATEE